MQNVNQGAGCTNSPAQTPIGVLRQHVLSLIVGNSVFTAAEQLLANHNIAECERLSQLVRWAANLANEAETRLAVRQATGQVYYATARQKEEIIRLLNHVHATRQEKTKCLLNINRLTEAAADVWIMSFRATLDARELAATFMPGTGLTFAQLA